MPKLNVSSKILTEYIKSQLQGLVILLEGLKPSERIEIIKEINDIRFCKECGQTKDEGTCWYCED
jgi:hypothetical protein